MWFCGFQTRLPNDMWSRGFLTCAPALQLGRTRLEVNIKLKASFNAQLFAMNVVVTIPVPDNTANADLQTSQGGLDTPVLVTSSSCDVRWKVELNQYAQCQWSDMYLTVMLGSERFLLALVAMATDGGTTALHLVDSWQ
jgi:hypothetical protein